MSKALNLSGMLLVIVLGGGLYQLKHVVEEKDRILDELYRAHVEDQKAVRVLGAEWAFLNSPEYLQEMAVRHLRLAPTLPTQVIRSLSDIPYRPGGDVVSEGDAALRYPTPRVKPLSGAGSRLGETTRPREVPADADARLVPASYGSHPDSSPNGTNGGEK